MSKLFTSSSPFSQATYSPLRNAHENNYHDDEDTDEFASSTPSSRTGSPRQFRNRSHSRSSNRSVHMPDSPHQLQQMAQMPQSSQQQKPYLSFSQHDDDDDDDSEDGHARPVIRTHPADVVADRTSRRNSAIRPQSMTGSTVVTVEGGASLSPPPKYTAEAMGGADPEHGRHGRNGDVGLPLAGAEFEKGDGLLMQASTTLVIAVSGLICAGWLLDVIQ
ncbi:hypothetical protein BGZ94_004546, partial [Podila epigama]